MNKQNMGVCKSCGKKTRIVNKYWGLCLICNIERLGASKGQSGGKVSKKHKSLPTGSYGSERGNIRADEEFYERCFNNSDHRCEECGRKLPEKFRDDDGKIIARWQYSHIVPKSIAPELRHDMKNINILCLECHMKWENGDRKSMSIYEENKRLFPQYVK